VGERRFVCGIRFCEWIKSPNFKPSRTKNTGVIISGHVPVAFFGVELQGKTTRIARRVGRALFSGNS